MRPRLRMDDGDRCLVRSVGLLVSAVLISQFVLASAEDNNLGYELLQVPVDNSKVEKALRSLEAKLNEVSPTPEHAAWQAHHSSGNVPQSKSDISDQDVLMHMSPIRFNLFNLSAEAKPGQHWTSADQATYDAEMTRALGFAAPNPTEDHIPAMYLPLASLPLQRDYAHNLVHVLQNMKEGYMDELVKWAVSGEKGENPYITPIIETLEAPLVKDLDQEAHAKVATTVAALAKKNDLTSAEMKEIRARLLVPLLLRIRARVHQQVQTYVVSMLRRIILYSTSLKAGSTVGSNGILAPEAGTAPHASEDEHMEYTLRDIDALFEKGVLSQEDYQAEKAKLLSDWLGLAIKQIGGKQEARKALEEFLWPPTMTVKGCRCMLPFKFNVKSLGKEITYDECTDIENPEMYNATGIERVPGPGWCAVDPDDQNCGHASVDARAFIGEGGYGWTHWDVCRSQPPAPQNGVVPIDPNAEVLTEHGCTCKLPFEIFPLTLGGRIKRVLTACTRAGGEEADWCATVGPCGRSGTPQGLGSGQELSWSHWDRCIGEPAGYLAAAVQPIRTQQGCYCRPMWRFKPSYFPKAVMYGGCTDIDSPGTAWCAVVGDSCGEIGKKGLGWTRWDVCEAKEQPDEIVKELAAGILPTPMPVVRTKDGCTCKLPYRISAAETNYQVVTMRTCNRFGRAAAWCPVREKDCGRPASKGRKKLGWTRWDLCVGEAAGFLTPEKPRVLTQQGCVCKLPFRMTLLGGKGPTVFALPTDIYSPNRAWCAVDAERSPADCGIKSVDPESGFGPGRYGWDHWDYLAEAVVPHPQGLVPAGAPRVATLNGCTCRMPYSITPPGVGEKMLFSTCNRYDLTRAGVTTYWWCLVEGDSCGQAGPQGRWDRCIGEPAGYLEPTPTETVQGCTCQLPFLYRPEAFASKHCGEGCAAKTMLYTACTDIDQRGGKGSPAPAWCATVGACGTPRARAGATPDGWTHWDVCKPAAQPSPAAAAVATVVRTQNGCRCVLPFKYAPMDTCSISQEKTAAACAAKGGDVISGWCVACRTETFTSCTYLDQGESWCAVEGACGTKSADANSLKPAEQGGYGWTHWDRCIGEAAGHVGVERPYAELFPPANASLLRALYPHALLHSRSPSSSAQGPAPAATAAPHPDEDAHPHPHLHAARSAATHPANGAPRRAPARHAASGAAHRKRGREQALTSRGSEEDPTRTDDGPAGPHDDEAHSPRGETGHGRGREIDALEREMARSLRTLNAKLDRLDDAPHGSASARHAARALPAVAAMAAVMAAWRLA